jgi:hypothetical protein
MRHAPLLAASLSFAFALVAGPARAQLPTTGALLVYVTDVEAREKLAADASALTAGLCAALAKDKRIEVLCAPDVKQLLGFAATTSMLGTGNPATEKLQGRIDATRFVVSGKLTLEKDTFTFTTAIGDKGEGADFGGMFASSTLQSATEKATGKPSALLAKLPSMARALVDKVASPTPAPATPPAPLATTK